MFCPKCGKKNDDEAKFCNSCGAGLSGKPTTKPPRASMGFSIGKVIGFAVLFVVLIVVLVAIFTMVFVVSSSTKGHDTAVSSTQQEQQVSGERKTQAQSVNDQKLQKETLDDGTELVYGVVSNVAIGVLDVDEFQRPIGNKHISERPQGKFVGVTVLVANEQNDAITVAMSSYKLIDEKGREYDVSTSAMTAWEMSRDGQGFLTKINPGNSAPFVFIFDVPRNADLKNFRLRARAGMIGDSVDLPLNFDPKHSLE